MGSGTAKYRFRPERMPPALAVVILEILDNSLGIVLIAVMLLAIFDPGALR